jgi:hypothetical protein
VQVGGLKPPVSTAPAVRFDDPAREDCTNRPIMPRSGREPRRRGRRVLEDYEQQYLYKNPHGYRCHATTGVPFPA